jgi:hypothetical protein
MGGLTCAIMNPGYTKYMRALFQLHGGGSCNVNGVAAAIPVVQHNCICVPSLDPKQCDTALWKHHWLRQQRPQEASLVVQNIYPPLYLD